MSTDGGPAFPQPVVRQLFTVGECGGMTLRDWFAGKVLEGLVADGILQGTPTTIRLANAAAVSYALADAMLAERAK